MENQEKNTITITVPVYYSTKMKKYYFNNCSVMGDYVAQTVYGGDNLKGGEIKYDKNGKRFIIGILEIRKNKQGNSYYYCIGYYDKTKKEDKKVEF